MSEHFNCIGYVYSQVGITDTEIYCSLPTFTQVLDLFDVVPACEAKVVGIAKRRPNGEKLFIHLAMLEDEGAAVRHRRECGGEVCVGDIDVEMDVFLTRNNSFFYLRRKSG